MIDMLLLFSSLSHILLSFVSIIFVSPGNLKAIQKLIRGRTTQVKLIDTPAFIWTIFPDSLVPCRIFMSVCVDDIKMVGRKESLAPIRAKLRKKIELADPRPVIDQVYLECTQRAATFYEERSELRPRRVKESQPQMWKKCSRRKRLTTIEKFHP